jgi:hypothetical protein
MNRISAFFIILGALSIFSIEGGENRPRQAARNASTIHFGPGPAAIHFGPGPGQKLTKKKVIPYTYRTKSLKKA